MIAQQEQDIHLHQPNRPYDHDTPAALARPAMSQGLIERQAARDFEEKYWSGRDAECGYDLFDLQDAGLVLS